MNGLLSLTGTLQSVQLHNLHKKLLSVTQKDRLPARAFTSASGAGAHAPSRPRSPGAAMQPGISEVRPFLAPGSGATPDPSLQVAAPTRLQRLQEHERTTLVLGEEAGEEALLGLPVGRRLGRALAGVGSLQQRLTRRRAWLAAARISRHAAPQASFCPLALPDPVQPLPPPAHEETLLAARGRGLSGRGLWAGRVGGTLRSLLHLNHLSAVSLIASIQSDRIKGSVFRNAWKQ